jgi:hypothetical protein
MNESEITKTITDWLKTLPNVWWMKIYGQGFSRGGKQKTGVPDLCVESTRHGRLWVEVKTPKGKLETSQEREFPKMEAAGAKVIIVRSLEELRTIMDDLEMDYYR